MLVKCALIVFLVLQSAPVFAEEQPAFSRALAAYEQRDLDKALEYAREAVRKNPGHVDAQILLGELCYLRQDLTGAREAWQKALQLAPGRTDVRERLKRLQQESSVEQSLARSDTRPFVLRFADGQIPIDLGSLRLMLRDTYRKVGQQLDYFPEHTITVILYPEADFEKVKSLSHPVGGLYDGKIRLPLKPGRMTGGRLERILWHEYTHALVHDLGKGRCPLWLNEGIAQVQEARVQPVDVTLFRTAWKQKQLPAWDSLWNATEYQAASMAVNYQTSYVIAQYLVKRWGWSELVGLLQKLGQGYPMSDALKAQYKEEPAVIEQEWRSWLRRNPP